MTGGASRSDVESLVILLPVSVLVLGAALFSLKKSQAKYNFWVIVGGGAITTLAASHVLPLPPFVWSALGENTEILEIDNLAGLSGTWRPLTVSPIASWQALIAIFTPIAILILGVQLNHDNLVRLLPILIGLGMTSAVLGILQIIGGAESPLYIYRITNNGSAVGLFANRNHSATLLSCLFPMLATFYLMNLDSIGRNLKNLFIVGIIGIVLVPLILVTGSRAGLLTAVMGLVGAAILFLQPVLVQNGGRAHNETPSSLTPIIIGLVVICMAIVTMYYSRAEAIERLFAQPSKMDNRSDFWQTSVTLAWTHFPFGSGSGAFAEAYRVAEYSQLLDATYLNRAHNDWIETAVSFGLPGLLLIVAGIILYFFRSLHLWRLHREERESVNVARMAGLSIAIITITSFVDYPLRTPIMMSVFAVLILWFFTNEEKCSNG